MLWKVYRDNVPFEMRVYRLYPPIASLLQLNCNKGCFGQNPAITAGFRDLIVVWRGR